MESDQFNDLTYKFIIVNWRIGPSYKEVCVGKNSLRLDDGYFFSKCL